MPKIVVSYRRADSEGITGRIVDRLVQHYGKELVFVDIDNIPFGIDFRTHIQAALADSDVMIEIVGPRWLGGNRRGMARIKEPTDPVRIEVETALQKRIPIIPVLVDGADMPAAADLPESLGEFSYINAAPVDPGRDFHQHVDRLIRSLERLLDGSAGAPTSQGGQPNWSAGQAASADEAASPGQKQAKTTPSGSDGEPSYACARDAHWFAPGPKRILALDGGGRRSCITIAFLERIEEMLAQTVGRPVLVGEYFDLIGGSSIGAVISAALAVGYRVSDIKSWLFDALAGSAGRSAFWRWSRNAARIDADRLYGTIRELLGDQDLSSESIRTGLCVLTKRAETGTSWFVTNNPRTKFWDSPIDREWMGNRYIKLANLVCASVAIPHSFETVRVSLVEGGQETLFVDSALSPHANPSLALFHVATLPQYRAEWRPSEDDLAIISIGAGMYRDSLDPREPSNRFARNPNQHLRSLAADVEGFIVAQMQWLGREVTAWPINSELGDVGRRPEPRADKLFRFARYDVRLERAWLLQTCGEDRLQKQIDIDRLRHVDDRPTMDTLYQIARAVACAQVTEEHVRDLLAVDATVSNQSQKGAGGA